MGPHEYNFVYIIPLHVKDILFLTAIDSLKRFSNTRVIISCTNEVKIWAEGLARKHDKDATPPAEIYLGNDNDKSSYAQLTNAGLACASEMTDVDFISILEFDDTVPAGTHDSIWPWLGEEADIFSPLAAMVTGIAPKDGEKPNLNMIAILNEAPLATGIAEEYGKMDTTMMLKANFAFVNGMYIRPSVFKEYGVFKENFEILTDYEWVLRMLYLGAVPLTIPRIARFHFHREDSEFYRQKQLPGEYREKWLRLVRREYLFTEDRDLSED